jgi:hypothetical protein
LIASAFRIVLFFVGGLVVLTVASSVLGTMFVPHLAVLLGFGWAMYPFRVAPLVRVDGLGVLAALFTAAALWGLAHVVITRLCERLEPPRRWRRRDTTVSLVALTLVFTAGMAATGIAHQVGWLLREEEPLIEETAFAPPWEQRRAHEKCEALKGSASKTGWRPEDIAVNTDPRFYVVPTAFAGQEVTSVLVALRPWLDGRYRAGELCSPSSSKSLDREQVARTLAGVRATLARAHLERVAIADRRLAPRAAKRSAALAMRARRAPDAQADRVHQEPFGVGVHELQRRAPGADRDHDQGRGGADVADDAGHEDVA